MKTEFSGRRTHKKIIQYLVAALALSAPLTGMAWEKHCRSNLCSVYDYASVGSPDDPNLFLVEAFDSGRVTLTVVTTRANHEKWYTTNPPTHVEIDGTEYVPAVGSYSDSMSGTLSIEWWQGIHPQPGHRISAFEPRRCAGDH